MRLRSRDTLKALMAQNSTGIDRLSRKAQCSRGFISHLTSGRREACKPETAARIAEALNVPVDVLFAPKVSTTSTNNDPSQVSA